MCRVSGHRTASAERVRQLDAAYPGRKVRRAVEEEDEVHWVGASLDADNRTREWLGGSQATFLRKP